MTTLQAATARGSNPSTPCTPQYELQNVQPNATPITTSNSVSNSETFEDQIGSIRDSLSNLDQHIIRTSQLHSQSISSAEPSNQSHVTEISNQKNQTSGLINDLKDCIISLQSQAKPSEPDSRAKKEQIGAVANQFKESIQRYQQMEQESKGRYRQRIERQFRIVKPEATDEEVRKVVKGDQTDQILPAQAVMDSNWHGESQAAYRDVQTCHEKIVNIEKTLEQLAQLLNDLALFGDKDEDNISQIHALTTDVQESIATGLGHKELAVKNAKVPPTQRVSCFLISLIIGLAVFGTVVGVVVRHAETTE